MKFKNLIIVLVALALFGCNQQNQKIDIVHEGAAPAIRVDDAAAPYAKLRMNSVVILDPQLQQIEGPGKIAVENTGSTRTETGTLEVWATLRNRTNYPLQIEGRTNFFTENEAPIDTPTAWSRVFLPELGTGVYKAKSTLIHGIKYYMIELREGR